MLLKKLLPLCVIALSIQSILCTPLHAQSLSHSPDAKRNNTIEVAYKTFYSHTRKLSGDDITALRFAFGFTNIRQPDSLCQLTNAFIRTQKVNIDLAVTPEQRFSIPTEKALKLAEAKLVIDVVEPVNQCDLNVQIETLPEYLNVQYSQQELEFIEQQYMAFFDEMGGFMSFMMPTVSGLQIRFAEQSLNQQLDADLAIVQGILRIPHAKLASISTLQLPEKPLRITALTESK